MKINLKRLKNYWIYFIAILVPISIPISALLYKIELYKGKPYYSLIPSSLGVVFPLLYIACLYKNRDRDAWKKFKYDFYSLITNSTFSVTITTLFSSVISFTYLFLMVKVSSDSNSPIAELANAFYMYVTFAAISLGIIAFHKKNEPIADVMAFLKLLQEDISECIYKEKLIWFVFPGLNIGYHRAFGDHEKMEIYNQYSRVLKDAFEEDSLVGKITLITYPENLFSHFFDRYEHQIIGGIDNNRLDKTIKEALDLCKIFHIKHSDNNHYRVHPNEFPPSLVIVGDTVYTILVYGMPFFKEKTDISDGQRQSGFIDGEFSGGFHHRLSLLINKIEDPEFALQVDTHLRSWLNESGRRIIPDSSGLISQNKT